MAIAVLIQIGDRLDVKIEQKVERDGKIEYEQKTYQSQVLDIKENGKFEVSMPIEKGKVIVPPLNLRFEAVFNTQSGNVYKGSAVVTERYRASGRYLMEIQLKGALQKIQRREFFRYPCLVDFNFLVLDEVYESKSVEEMYMEFMEGRLLEISQGTTRDLSAGGMRFKSPCELDADKKIFIVLHLKNEKIDRDFFMFADVVSSERSDILGKVSYENRVKFEINDNEMREEIIRFVFEEERRHRKR